MQFKNRQIFSQKHFYFLLFSLLTLTIFAVLFFNFKSSNQTTEISPVHFCNRGSLYDLDFNTGQWTLMGCEVPGLPGCGEWNLPGYCSRHWTFKHPVGESASLVCALQVCNKVNGIYVCQEGFTLDELVDNALAGDTTGWITRECFSAEEIRDEYACSEAGGSFLSRYNFCSQPIAVKNLKLGNRVDCNQAGGLWHTRLSECRIPQDLLLEIDPGNPEANCGVAGVEACAVVRWLQRERSDFMNMVTLNIGPK